MQWDAVLGNGNTSSFADSSWLFKTLRITPFVHWKSGVTYLEHWAVDCHTMIGGEAHPGTKQMENILGATDPLRSQLRDEAKIKPTFPVSLVRELQLEFNESF